MKKYILNIIFIIILLLFIPSNSYAINTNSSSIIKTKQETKLNIRKERVKIYGNKSIDAILDGNDKFSPTSKLNLSYTGSDFSGSSIDIEIDSNTTIKANSSSGLYNLSKFGVQDASLSNKQLIRKKIDTKNLSKKYDSKKRLELIKRVKTFEFGIPGTPLIFSKPIKVSINTPDLANGTLVELYVKHEGETDFGIKGLTLDPNQTCNTDGSVSGKTIENTNVENGKIVFYTCSASSYTINPTGGTAGSNDLKLIVGDCAQIQPYYNGLAQIYGGNPPTNGCGGANAWPALRIGGITVGNGFTNWTTRTTSGSQVGNVYNVKNTMVYSTGGRNYGLTIDWNYQAPNKYFTWSYNVSIPAGNTQNIRFYYGQDSYVAGADTNDVGYFTMTGGKTVGVYDGTALVLSAFRYISGPAWTAHEVSGYATVKSRILGGTDFSNTVSTGSADQGYGINWNFGTTPATYTGTIEWRMAPYVTANVVDLIPGIGQPEANLVVNTVSQLPINITNVGNLTSSGVHTVVLRIPTNILGPQSSFSNNGWSCGAQSGTTSTCTKTTTIQSYNVDPLAIETVRIPVKPLLAAQGTTVTFTGTISNPGDSNNGNNVALATLQVAVGAAPVNNPGGIAGSRLWLRANDLLLSDGTGVTTWTNRGNLGTDATQTTLANKPAFNYKTTTNLVDNINFNPVVNFNGTNNWMQVVNGTFGTLSYTGVSVYIVGINSNLATNNYVLYQTTTSTGTTPRFSLALPSSSGSLYYDAGDATTSRVQATWGGTVGKPNIWAFQKNTVSTANGYKSDIRRDGRLIGSGTTTLLFTGTNNNMFLGAFSGGTSNFLSGKLAEVLLLAPSALTSTGQNQIESYLAIKYGITLDQTTPTNYLLSSGAIAFNTSIMTGFTNNIAGIARDDSSDLMQLKSQSVTNTGDIIVSALAPIGLNYSSLMWGNDGTATGTWTSTDSPAIDKVRITREWRFEENGGDTSDLKLSYPASSIPAGFTGSLYLFVDINSIFSTGATTYTGSFSGTTNTWDFSVNLADGQYITFGQNNPDISPPTITYNSISSGSLLPIGNYSFSFNYTDTGAGINTGSIAYTLAKWNSGTTSYGANIAGTYIPSPNIGATGATLPIDNLPFGRYKLTLTVPDLAGNTATGGTTFYIDDVELIIDTGSLDIGNLTINTKKFTPELSITVKTLGAPFNLYMIQNGNFAYLGNIIVNWNGTQGFGYDLNPYTTNISLINGNQLVGTGVLNINTSGDKNIYTFKTKLGVLYNNPEQVAGSYQTNLNFLLQFNY